MCICITCYVFNGCKQRLIPINAHLNVKKQAQPSLGIIHVLARDCAWLFVYCIPIKEIVKDLAS